MNLIPLVERDSQDRFARLGDHTISVGQFCADIRAVAEALPDKRFLVNLCRERYAFTVCFFAALARESTNLLPARREPQFARTLSASYESCCIVGDEEAEGLDIVVNVDPGASGTCASPAVSSKHIAAIAFTSGSTGEPQAHAKPWQMLDSWRHVHWRYLPGERNLERGLVATVPSWHMYGLEWALLLPTIAPLTLHCGADFYPQDVVAALASFEEPSILVSTPVHLRAMRNLANPPANVCTVLSATAPLDDALTSQVEGSLQAELFEIYGCSEVGSLASRVPSQDKSWQFFDCFDISYQKGSITVDHDTLLAPVTLADRFKQLDAERYELEGRNTDIIKIGGKRESLANLNHILLNIAGVEDGVIYDPTNYGLTDTGRLAALVVAPGLTGGEIRSALARDIEPAFYPRPIRIVEQLPRDTTSKLKQADLEQLIVSHSAND